ncbi:protein-L-isoaspartate O-methyltransferase family protein [Nocardioides limicola]|uniref:protein-L-isoaspartate O-methyltransferase family protein n=1 Tax=Nocardioides limicola TaxID=2803368 RepID=UPI00193B1EE2|nr:protein-L-isoaspartate O-methyltransferase [Nocardioides sp. DJM-14]
MDTLVAEAFAATPREWFLPTDKRGQAGYDGPLAIGHDQTNSQPRTVADMLELLDVRPGMSVLDVGAGSGWTTALLAHLVGPTGTVRGIERVEALVEFGRHNLERAGRPWARIQPATPGVLGDPEHAPYERILVSAEAEALPSELVEQLADGATMVIPVAGEMHRVVRARQDVIVTRHGHYRFVPLLR